IWAVGYYDDATGRHTLTEHWNGGAWSVVPNPDAESGSQFTAVTATGAGDVWAVGSASGHTLTEHWDGSAWTVVPWPPTSGGSFLAGAVALSAGDVWAVGSVINGSNAQTLTERYSDPCLPPSTPTPTGTVSRTPAPSATATPPGPSATPCAINF